MPWREKNLMKLPGRYEVTKTVTFMLYETSKPFIRIGDEIKMLDDYMELERIRYNGRLTINFLREIDQESCKD